MRDWSKEQTVLDVYTVTIGLDTNILSFLVDKSYSTLDKVYNVILNSPFTEQVSSRFVIYEYIGIRKKEHFLRKALSFSNPGSSVNNISSILKYKDEWKTSDLDYIDVVEHVIDAIDSEKDVIQYDLKVAFENSMLHNSLFNPAYKLHLNSRISKEDSLVAISLISLSDTSKLDRLCILTGDNDFVSYWNDVSMKERIESVFSEYNLPIPKMINARNIKGMNSMNNTIKVSDADIFSKTNTLIKELIIEKNKNSFIGTTFDIQCSKNSQVVCFQLESDITLPKRPYLTIIGKDLDFILYSSSPVDSFRNKAGGILEPQTIKIGDHTENKFSFMWPDIPDLLGMAAHSKAIYESIHESGNLIFLYPSAED